jgi:tetratricopeptide (TPR) repeat protein
LLGKIYVKQKKLDKATECYDEMIKRVEPDSIDAAHAYNLMGDINLQKARLSKELNRDENSIRSGSEYYRKARKITRKLGDDHIEYVNYSLKIADVGALDDQPKSVIACCERILPKLRAQSPNSTDLALCLRKLALHGYAEQQKYTEALALFEESLKILKAKPYAPISEAHRLISEVAYLLRNYDLALEHADAAVKAAPEYSYAHLARGQALENMARERTSNPLDKKKKLQDALESYNKSLEYSPGERYATMNRLSVSVTLAEMEKSSGVKVSQASSLSRYASEAKALSSSAQSGKTPSEPETPRTRPTPAQNQAELAGLLDRVAKLGIKLEDHETRLSQVEERVENLEARMTILEGQVYDLMSAMEMVTNIKSDLNRRIAEAQLGSELLSKLQMERQKLEDREKLIKEFNKNPDLADYFFALLSEIEAAYIAARAVQSKQVDITSDMDKSKSAIISKATHYTSNLVKLIPVVGKAASALIHGIEITATAYNVASRTITLEKIADVSETVTGFDQIALRVAVELTQSNKDKIVGLKGAEIDNNWKEHLKEAKRLGLVGAFTSLMEKNKTQAKLLGRLDAHQVILYLQQERVAQGLRFEEERDVGQSTYKTRHSVIAEQIALAILEPKIKPSTSVANPKASSKCCVVM